MRTAFIRALEELAEKDERIMLIIGDLGFGVVEPFQQKYPDRFLNAGVAEQNMTGMAAGLALSGKTVFTYSIGNFPSLRALEQVRNDVCYHKANVKIVSIGAGYHYGALGMTHHATEDVAIMRALPNMTVFSPADGEETALGMREIVEASGPCYIRLTKDAGSLYAKNGDWKIGKAVVVKEGKDVALLSTGAVLREALESANELEQQGYGVRVVHFHTVKPIDAEEIRKTMGMVRGVVTIEEHSVVGGFGSAVVEVASSGKNRPPIEMIGSQDMFAGIVGDQQTLKAHQGITIAHIVEKTKDILHP